VLKIEKVSDTCVSSIDMDKREVWLAGHKTAFRYRDDSLTALLQKAMTRKATFITKDGVIDWIDLKKNEPTYTHIEASRGNERKYQNLVDLSSDIIITENLKGVITSINEAGEKISGYSKDELIGKRFWKIGHLPVKDVPKYMKMLASAVRGKTPEPFEATWDRKDGTPCTCELRTYIMKNNAKIVGFQVIMKDITEHKKTEKELKESEEKFKNLAEQSQNMIFINKKGKIVYANKKCEEIMGYKKEEFCSPDFDFLMLIAPESLDLIKSSYGRHMKGEEVPPYEYRLVTKEGKKIDAILTTKLIAYEGETAILGTVTDISERKNMEEKLKASEEHFREVLENSQSVLYKRNIVTGRYEYISPAITKITGYTPNEVMAMSSDEVDSLIHPEDLKRINDLRLGILEHPKDSKMTSTLEYRVKCKDGNYRWISDNYTLFRDSKGRPLFSIASVIDITERKKAEKTLSALL